MDDFSTCPACGTETPAENLNCIYCGEVLPRPVGMMSGLRYSLRGWFVALIAIAVLISFLVLIL